MDNSEVQRTIYVGNLNDVPEAILYELCLQAGPIESVKIPIDKNTGNPKNFGFVCFHHECTVPYAIHLLNGIQLLGRNINVQNRDKRPLLPVDAVGIHSIPYVNGIEGHNKEVSDVSNDVEQERKTNVSGPLQDRLGKPLQDRLGMPLQDRLGKPLQDRLGGRNNDYDNMSNGRRHNHRESDMNSERYSNREQGSRSHRDTAYNSHQSSPYSNDSTHSDYYFSRHQNFERNNAGNYQQQNYYGNSNLPYQNHFNNVPSGFYMGGQPIQVPYYQGNQQAGNVMYPNYYQDYTYY